MKVLSTLMVVLAFSTSVQADSIKGTFVIGGKALELSEIAAFRVRNQLNARQYQTYVIWSAAKVDQIAINASRDPYTTAINDPAVKDTDFVAFSVQPDGVISMNARVDGVQYLDTSGRMMGQPGSLKASCRPNTATRVDCDVATPEPVKSMDGPTWELQAKFDVAVLSKPVDTPLPAGGGDAGKALLALCAAHKEGNKAALLAQLDPEEAEDYSADWRSEEENTKALVEHFNWRLPKQPKIAGGEVVAADRVLLEVEGVPYEDGKMLYEVEMHKVDGAWRFISSSTLGILK